MSEIKALEKLRKYTLCDKGERYTAYIGADKIADEIQAEVDNRFMELPVDADGVPIYVGDEIQYVNDQGGTGAKVKVCAIANSYAFYDNGKHIHAYSSDSTRHAKPDPLNELLCDMIHEYGCTDALTETVAEKYAERIRELMGGDWS